MTDPERSQYLDRINLTTCDADLAGLMELQEHHMSHISFENLDIVAGRKIELIFKSLFDKVVTKHRGGYCFELNILYAELLRSLGFSAKPILGRVWLSNPRYTPPRNHLALLIELDGKTYVTDVGFAGLITRLPLNIHITDAMDDKDGMVRVIPFEDHQFMIQRQTEDGWDNLYSFEDIEIGDADIEIAHYYMSTHPKSHLIKHKCVGKITKEGRIGIFNNKISTRKGIKVIDKQHVAFGDDWLDAIKSRFALDLDYTDKEMLALFEA